MSKLPTILLAEDNPADVYLVREAMRVNNLLVDLYVMKDGETAIEFIDAADRSDTSPCPDLALLDLNLPKKSGLEVLVRLRQSAKCGNIPVAVLSSSKRPYALNEPSIFANHFFTKPSDYDRFMKLGVIVKSLLNHGQDLTPSTDRI